MRTITEAGLEIVRLITDMFRLWWRKLLPLLSWYLVGYIALLLATQAAVWLGEHQHRTLAIALFSAGVLVQIAALVAMIRTCANALFRWRDAAAGPDQTTDPTQRKLMELLSVTMLPLVLVWSAWGILDERIERFAVAYSVETAGAARSSNLFNEADWTFYLPALIGLLVLRRVLETVDDKWPNKPTKFGQIWAEAFFALLLVIVTPPLFKRFISWLDRREIWRLISEQWQQVKDWFAGISIPIPDGLEWMWELVRETLWPLFYDGVAQPMTWLAVTTVVFGHRALSAGSIVQGTRFESRIAERGGTAASGRVASLTSRAPELVFGGLKEKFIPTLNAFRLVVRTGPVFLGVVCLVYSLQLLAQDWSFFALVRLLGDHGSSWGVMNNELTSFITSLIFEPLRVALLAAAFDQCVSVAVEQRQAAATEKRTERAEQGAPVRA